MVYTFPRGCIFSGQYRAKSIDCDTIASSLDSPVGFPHGYVGERSGRRRRDLVHQNDEWTSSRTAHATR